MSNHFTTAEECEIDEQAIRPKGHAFVVRIWRQPAGDVEKGLVWRGSIDDVGGGERLYFSDLAAIARFIQDRAEIGLHGQSSRWTAIFRRFVQWMKT